MPQPEKAQRGVGELFSTGAAAMRAVPRSSKRTGAAVINVAKPRFWCQLIPYVYTVRNAKGQTKYSTFKKEKKGKKDNGKRGEKKGELLVR